EWVTKGDGTAHRVDLGRVQIEVVDHGQRLGGEGFVELDPVHLVLLEAGRTQGGGNGFLGTDTHDLGWHAAHRERYEARQWRQVELLEYLLTDNDQRTGAVRS